MHVVPLSACLDLPGEHRSAAVKTASEKYVQPCALSSLCVTFKTPYHACQAPPDTGPRMNLVSSTWECCLWVAGAVVIGRPTLISGHGQLVSRNADFVFKLTIKFERPLFVCRCCNFQHHHGTMCIHHYRRYIQLLSSFTSISSCISP
eukprot:scpid12961/ scgid24535/ 